MLTTLLLWTQLAMAALPPPLQLSPADEATLAKGEAVIRDNGDGMAIGIVNVKATPEALWTQVLNVEPRVEEVGPSTLCTINSRTADTMNVTWGAGMMGMSVTFHLDYVIDHANKVLSFDLDRSRENDIGHSPTKSSRTQTVAGSSIAPRMTPTRRSPSGCGPCSLDARSKTRCMESASAQRPTSGSAAPASPRRLPRGGRESVPPRSPGHAGAESAAARRSASAQLASESAYRGGLSQREAAP